MGIPDAALAGRAKQLVLPDGLGGQVVGTMLNRGNRKPVTAKRWPACRAPLTDSGYARWPRSKRRWPRRAWTSSGTHGSAAPARASISWAPAWQVREGHLEELRVPQGGLHELQLLRLDA